jgi:hypothetical protein
LIREGEGVAAQILVSLGIDLGRLRQDVIRLMSSSVEHPEIVLRTFRGPRNRLAANAVEPAFLRWLATK